MQLSDEHKKVIEEQKKQCPFCKIMKGEIPSKKIYDGEEVVGLLDINPLTEGHVLLMPKDHYPILPLIPDETKEVLFRSALNLSDILWSQFQKPGTTLFIANGAAAGQQTAHFLMHLFARDETFHTSLNLDEQDLDPKKTKEIVGLLRKKLGTTVTEEAPEPEKKQDAQDSKPIDSPTTGSVVQSHAIDQVVAIIRKNADLLDLMLKEPALVKKSIPHHPQLEKLFKEVSFEEVLHRLREDDSQDSASEETENEPLDKSFGFSNDAPDDSSDSKETDEKEEKESATPESSTSDKPKPDLDDITGLFK